MSVGSGSKLPEIKMLPADSRKERPLGTRLQSIMHPQESALSLSERLAACGLRRVPQYPEPVS